MFVESFKVQFKLCSDGIIYMFVLHTQNCVSKCVRVAAYFSPLLFFLFSQVSGLFFWPYRVFLIPCYCVLLEIFVQHDFWTM